MKKVLALVVTAAMGLSSAAFAADATTTTQAPVAAAPTTHAAPAKAQHVKKLKKHVKHEATKPAAQPAA